MNVEYAIQNEPKGLVEAFIIGRSFINGSRVCLILGDNIFYGSALSRMIIEAASLENGARVFGYSIKDPERYGVVEYDRAQNVVSIEETPANPKSNYAVVGLYFYDSQIVSLAESFTTSVRGELEITNLNRLYLGANQLTVSLIGRSFVWLVTGTQESLLETANFVRIIDLRQGIKISCIEGIVWRKTFKITLRPVYLGGC